MSRLAKRLAKMSPSDQRLFLDDPSTKAKTGQLEKLYQILTQFDFLAAKINHPEFGVQSLMADYDLLDDAEVLTHPEYNSEKVKALKLIQGALGLSARILNQDKTQLAIQLCGRLASLKMPEIQELLVQAKPSKTPWFRPLKNYLTSPTARLLFTFKGHSDSVRAVAITPDGKKAISGSDDKTLKLWNLETGSELFTFNGHSGWVRAVAITPDGKKAISGSDDKTLKLW
ncbi:WD40 repeat domain-containing protein, partial [Argonema galeatum]|uniref:WD40 repeat domain-containing protein n=1 Tax=Argonema galeatum TaxID=2942762 RepID=UPI003B849EA5|nr:hypothetical protein [Argonema galeatum A003/A1]